MDTTEKKSKKKRYLNDGEDIIGVNLESPKKKKKTKHIEETAVNEEYENIQSENDFQEFTSKVDVPVKGKLQRRDDHKLDKKANKKKYFDVEDNNEIIHEQPKTQIQPKSLAEDLFVIKEEDEDLHLENDVEQVNSKAHVIGDDTWSKEDYLELIKRMELQLPKNDTKSFTNRAEKLDWKMIQFKNYSIEECYEKWKIVRSKIRHFRLLSEVLQDAKEWALKPWTIGTGNKKKVRHPEQPPRPLSSFMLFYMDKKNKMIKRHPELKLTDISRLIGEKYKYLAPEKKEYYLQKAKAMQEEYKENLSKFYQKHPELLLVSKRQPTISNKPLPPMRLYIKDRLQKHQNDENFNRLSYTERYKEMWKTLSVKKKAFWIRLARDEEEKYLEHLHENELHEDEDKPTKSYKSVISKEENAILDRLAGKPEKPPNSAYSLFSRLMLQDKDKNHVDGEPKNRMREVAKMWKETPEEQKKVYAEKVQHMLENYKLEFANYLEGLPEDKKAEELAKVQPKKKRVKKKVIKKDSTHDSDKQKLFKNEPEQPPITAWDLFKNEFFKKNSHMHSKMAYKQAACIWKTLSKKEIEKYKKKHEHLKTQYMVDYAAFLDGLSEEQLKEYSALKNERSAREQQNEDSNGEESSSEADGNSSGNTSDSSKQSDSGVSEDG